jgi:hypothetical protein
VLDVLVTMSITLHSRHVPNSESHHSTRLCSTHDDLALILDEPYDDAPLLEDRDRLAALSRGTTVTLFQLSERVNCGFFQVGRWDDGAMVWQITHFREEPESEEYQVLGVPPDRFAGIAAPYRAKQARADAAGDRTCHLGRALVDLLASLTGVQYDLPGWWRDLRYRVLVAHR